MTVADLIAHLSTFPSDMRIALRDQHGEVHALCADSLEPEPLDILLWTGDADLDGMCILDYDSSTEIGEIQAPEID